MNASGRAECFTDAAHNYTFYMFCTDRDTVLPKSRLREISSSPSCNFALHSSSLRRAWYDSFLERETLYNISDNQCGGILTPSLFRAHLRNSPPSLLMIGNNYLKTTCLWRAGYLTMIIRPRFGRSSNPVPFATSWYFRADSASIANHPPPPERARAALEEL